MSLSQGSQRIEIGKRFDGDQAQTTILRRCYIELTQMLQSTQKRDDHLNTKSKSKKISLATMFSELFRILGRIFFNYLPLPSCDFVDDFLIHVVVPSAPVEVMVARLL
jgi:hypothetical protein